MDVPFVDIAAQNRRIGAELRIAVDAVISRAQFICGPAVKEFEQQFAKYIGVEHCVGVNSGTSALHLALIACGVGPGDEVVTTPHTWISTSWAIRYVSATPVFVDIDPSTYNIDASLVEKAINSKTKAILPVHLYGQAADVRQLVTLAEAHNLVVIEDAAQAHGAVLGAQKIGSFGWAGCFSFYPGKNLGAFGEAGAVVTNDEEVAERIRRLRDHAQLGRHNHVELGFNTRMEGLQGAVLSVKLRYLDHWIALRRRHAEQYRRLLEGVEGLRLPSAPVAKGHVWHLFVVLVHGGERDALRKRLADKGIAAGVHYPLPVPFQPAFADLGYRPGDFPVAEEVMASCLSLPMFPELDQQQIEYTAARLDECLQEVAPVAV